MQEQVDTEGVDLGQEAHKVLSTAAQPVHRPRCYQVELAAAGVLAQSIERWAVLSRLMVKRETGGL